MTGTPSHAEPENAPPGPKASRDMPLRRRITQRSAFSTMRKTHAKWDFCVFFFLLYLFLHIANKNKV
jgi:hypothetical protein